MSEVDTFVGDAVSLYINDELKSSHDKICAWSANDQFADV